MTLEMASGSINWCDTWVCKSIELINTLWLGWVDWTERDKAVLLHVFNILFFMSYGTWHDSELDTILLCMLYNANFIFFLLLRIFMQQRVD